MSRRACPDHKHVASPPLLLIAVVGVIGVVAGTAQLQAVRADAHPGRWNAADELPEATSGKSVQLLDGRVFRIGAIEEQEKLTAAIFDPKQGAEGKWDEVSLPPEFNNLRLGDVVLLPRSRFRCGAGCVLVRAGDGSSPWAIYSEEEGWKLSGDVAQPDPPNLYGPTVSALDESGPFCGVNCGKVLVAGGIHSSGGLSGVQQSRAQLYDPVADLWTPADSSDSPRVEAAAVVMNGLDCAARCGDVFIVGGGASCFPFIFACAHSGKTAEFFDTLTGSFYPAVPPQFPHYKDHSATVMADGRVLIADTPAGLTIVPSDPDNHSEIFDPSANGGAGAWIPTRNDCAVCTEGHATTALPNGMVLAVGIRSDFDPTTADTIVGAQLFTGESWIDMTSSSSSGEDDVAGASPAEEVGNAHSQTLLTGSWRACGRHCGKVLLAGGLGPADEATNRRPRKRASQLFAPAPKIERIEPGEGSTKGGTRVVVRGTGLASAAAHSAAFEGSGVFACGDSPSGRCYPDPESPDSILHLITPRHPEGTADFSVTTDGGPSNRVPFRFELPVPLLQQVLPRCGPVGAEFPVTLTGEDLDAADGVNFGGARRQGTPNSSGTEMKALVPAQSSAGKLEVTVSSRGRVSDAVSLTIPCPAAPALVDPEPPPPATASGGASEIVTPPPVVNAPVPSSPGSSGTAGGPPPAPGPPPGAFGGGGPATLLQPNLVAPQAGSSAVLQPQVQLAPNGAAAPTAPLVAVEENADPATAVRYAMAGLDDNGRVELVVGWGLLFVSAVFICGMAISAKDDRVRKSCPAFSVGVR